MSYQINIRNTTNTGWINLLEAKYHEIYDIGGNYAADNVEDALAEVFVNKTTKVESFNTPGNGDYTYPIGTIWTNKTDNTAYLCTDNTTSYAVWKLITSTSSVSEIEDIVGSMVSDNIENGINVTYDNINGKLDFDVNDPLITLTGAVNGSGILQDLSNLTIDTTGDFYSKSESDSMFVNSDGDSLTGIYYINGTPFNKISNDSRLLEYSSSSAISEQAVKMFTNRSWVNVVLSKSFNTVETSGSSGSPSAAPLPVNGDRYIVDDNATGDWAGHEDEIAEYNNTNWIFLPHNESQTVYVKDEKRYYTYNGSDWVVMLNDVNIEVTDTLNHFTSEYLDGVLDELYYTISGTGTGLEQINENGNIGWRLVGKDPSYYGDIGDNAVDLSSTSGSITTAGATGDYSCATGLNVIASGEYSFVLGLDNIASGYSSVASGYGTVSQNEYSFTSGKYNIGTSTDTILEIGIGTSDLDRKNALEIYTDGTLTAPESTVTLIHDKGPKTLITREYFDNSTPNINLLINTDFNISQRDYVDGTILSQGEYGHDMWISDPLNYGTTGASLSKVGDNFTIGGGGNPCNYSQKNNDILLHDGKICTVSIEYGELTVSGCGCPYTNLNSSNGMSVTFTVDANAGNGFFYISNGTDTAGAAKIFRGLKFEIGSYKTRYVLYPISYSLQSCLDYFERVKSVDGIEVPSFAFGSFYTSQLGRAYFNYLRKVSKPTFTTFNVKALSDTSSLDDMIFSFINISTTGCIIESTITLTAQIHDWIEFVGVDETSYIDVDANYYS